MRARGSCSGTSASAAVATRLRLTESAKCRETARREQRQFRSKERAVGAIADRVRVDDPHEVCRHPPSAPRHRPPMPRRR